MLEGTLMTLVCINENRDRILNKIQADYVNNMSHWRRTITRQKDLINTYICCSWNRQIFSTLIGCVNGSWRNTTFKRLRPFVQFNRAKARDGGIVIEAQVRVATTNSGTARTRQMKSQNTLSTRQGENSDLARKNTATAGVKNHHTGLKYADNFHKMGMNMWSKML